jgi:hypothetical protein
MKNNILFGLKSLDFDHYYDGIKNKGRGFWD